MMQFSCPLRLPVSTLADSIVSLPTERADASDDLWNVIERLDVACEKAFRVYLTRSRFDAIPKKRHRRNSGGSVAADFVSVADVVDRRDPRVPFVHSPALLLRLRVTIARVKRCETSSISGNSTLHAWNLGRNRNWKGWTRKRPAGRSRKTGRGLVSQLHNHPGEWVAVSFILVGWKRWEHARYLHEQPCSMPRQLWQA